MHNIERRKGINKFSGKCKLEKNLYIILENLKEPYSEISLNGKIVFYNRAFGKFLNFPENEFMSKNYFDLIEGRHKQDFLKGLKKLRRNEQETFSLEYKMKVLSGHKFLVKSLINRKFNNNDEIIGYSILTETFGNKEKQEISEIKFGEKLEKSIKERTKSLNELLKQQELYQEEVLKASKFKTEFLATMSHELRTPLNAIIGFTDLLLEETYGKLNDEQLEYLSDIKDSAEHQFDMISNILDLTKIEAGQMKLNFKEFPLETVMNQIKSTFKPLIKNKNLNFIIEGLEVNKIMYADPIRFKEILLNLVSNAIKYTIEGQVKVIIKEIYDKYIFKVRDTGIGIARKDFDLVFKEFKRIESSYVKSTSGTGLGLSLTKRLVELHGGQISFTSVLGAGTTFTFFIPKKIPKDDIKLF
ncbi:MAG: ATP-binding protein [Candidatus Lokiarchaeota archaeon]